MENDKTTVSAVSAMDLGIREIDAHNVWPRIGGEGPMPPHFAALYSYERTIRGSDIWIAAQHARQQCEIIDNPQMRFAASNGDGTYREIQ